MKQEVIRKRNVKTKSILYCEPKPTVCQVWSREIHSHIQSDLQQHYSLQLWMCSKMAMYGCYWKIWGTNNVKFDLLLKLVIGISIFCRERVIFSLWNHRSIGTYKSAGDASSTHFQMKLPDFSRLLMQPYTRSTGCPDLNSKWIRLAPNRRNLGLLQI